MIKKTFYNLPKSKQERIINAIKTEFDRSPAEKLSINNIIKEANISRGSFYQYFDEKGDLYDILAEQLVEKTKYTYSNALSVNKGDIFRTADSLMEKYFVIGDFNFTQNRYLLLPKMSTNAKNIADRIETKMCNFSYTIIKNIDTSNLKISSSESLKALIELIMSVIRDVTFDYHSKGLSKERCLADYKRKMAIIKLGCIKTS